MKLKLSLEEAPMNVSYFRDQVPKNGCNSDQHYDRKRRSYARVNSL